MMIVLDALADDIESLEDILRVINSDTVIGWRHLHPAPFSNTEVIPALIRAIKRSLVQALVLDSAGKELVTLEPTVVPQEMGQAWFRMLPRGRIVHTNWDPPEGALG